MNKHQIRGLMVAGFVGALLAGTAVGASLTGVPASGTVSFTTNSGLTVDKGPVNEIPQQPFAGSETVQFDSGTVSGDGSGRVTIGSDLNGSPTRLEGITAGSTTITVNPATKREFAVSGGIDNITVQEGYDVDDNTDDFTYGGSGSSATVELTGLPTNTVIAAFEPATGKVVDSATTDGSGRLVLDELPLSSRTIQLVTGERAPEIENVSPTGAVSTSPLTIEADISDDDFPQDKVTVTISVDGTQESKQTIDGPTRVSTQVSGLTGGNHTFTINATDSFGNKNIQSFEFTLPKNATVFEISDDPERLNDRQLNGTFIRPDEDIVINRESSTGRFDFTGLPVDAPYIVEVEGPQVVDRRTTVFSIIEQEKFFLLNESADTVDAEFRVDDQTGDFGSRSILQIERQINTDDTLANERKYVVVAGDEIGSRAAFTTTIERGERYRVNIINPRTGNQRQLGSFQINQSRAIDLVVTGIDQGVKGREGETFGVSVDRTVTGSGANTSKTVEFVYQDPENETDSLTLVVHEAGKRSNVFRTTQASVGSLPLGTFKYSETFSGQAANTTLVANWTVERDGETIDRTVGFGVSDQRLGLPLGAGWTQIFGVGFLIVVGGIFSVANARIGALVIPGIALALNVSGILSGVVTVASVGLAFAIAVGYNLIVVSGPGGVGA